MKLRSQKVIYIAFFLAVFFSVLAFLLVIYNTSNKSEFATAASASTTISSQAEWEIGTQQNIDSTTTPGTLEIDDQSMANIDLSSVDTSTTADVLNVNNPKDGDELSYWTVNHPAGSSTDTWEVDFGSAVDIAKTRLLISAEHTSPMGCVFTLWYSNNGVDYTQYNASTICIGPNHSTKNWAEDNTPVTARYFRIKIGSMVSYAVDVRIYEYELYSQGNTAIHTSGLTQISGTDDLASWDSFATIESDKDQNGGNAATKIEYQFRSGDGDTAWDAWTSKQEFSGSNLSLAGLSHDSSHRYLQVLTTFTTTNSSFTPTLSEYTINYTTTSLCDNFDHVSITPTSATIDSEATTSVTATAEDASNEPLAGVGVSYSADCGSVNGSGVFSAPEVAIQTICTITATSDCGGSVTSTITINPIVPPTCSDEVQNGDETGVDCGGSCPVCEEPPVESCDDGIQNQDETSIDCGGVCPACEVPPTCSDEVQNGDETGVDCGGSCPACPLVCPLPNTSWCNTVECDNQIEITSPLAGSRYATGSTIDISWQNKSSAKSLIEAWNIRYNIDISYNGGEDFNRIASALKDINFSDQNAWQNIFADANWQSRLKSNRYRFNLPRIESAISDQVKIRINMYRTQANPYGCSSYAEDTSKNFSVYRDKIDPVCQDNQYYYSLPLNTVRASTANTQYYYLTDEEISRWPNLSFNIELRKNGQNGNIANSGIKISPSQAAYLNTNGKLVINSDIDTPQSFSLSYYDPACSKEYVLNMVAQRDSEQGRIRVVSPNGGEYWLLGKQYAIQWENSFRQDVVSYVAIHLSVDGGKSWDWKVTKDNKDSSGREMIAVDSLSLENSYLWDIPRINELITKEARVRISAYDKNGIFLASDTSDKNFEISNSEVGAAIDKVKNLLDEIAKALAALALLVTSAILAIPYIQNTLAFSSIYEQMYGILSSGKKRKNDWGLIYDAENGLAIPNALITLHDADSKRLIETTISNKDGRYGFIARKGKYFIKVKKQNYEIASSNIFARQGLKYQNNYLGETIIISEDEQVILANIPMRPLESLKKSAKNVSILSVVEKYLAIFNWPLISLGTIVSVLALYYSPNVVNLGILIIYIPLWIIQITRNKKIKAFGLVLESANMEPIDLALIRVVNQSDNRLVRTVASDLKGHYAVLIGRGRYNIFCSKPGFTSPLITDKVVDVGYKPLSDTIYLNKTEI